MARALEENVSNQPRQNNWQHRSLLQSIKIANSGVQLRRQLLVGSNTRQLLDRLQTLQRPVVEHDLLLEPRDPAARRLLLAVLRLVLRRLLLQLPLGQQGRV